MRRKTINDILPGIPVKQTTGLLTKQVTKLIFDSRLAEDGAVFFAIKGTITDGHNYINACIEKGCEIIFCNKIPLEISDDTITFIEVEHTAYAMAIAAANFYDHPSKELKLIGVTGTNGKTTIASLLYQLFENSGYPTGLLSTVHNKISKETFETTHTTLDPISINALLRKMVDKGCGHAFMEVSSHAMSQMRVFGLHFAGGIFTNLTHDHLDYHGTFAEYRDAKKLFFDILPPSAFALVNRDDKNGAFMLQNTKADCKTFGITSDADYKAKVIENHFEGLLLNIDGKELFTHLVGRFNASNLIAVYGAARLMGMSADDALVGLSLLHSAEGRFEFVKNKDQIVGIVDFAHSPNALENILNTINEIRTHNETLITVCGAGGDRDKSKRPEMAKIAAKYSDKLILTSDNPRSEEPEDIIRDMRNGIPGEYFKNTLSITDRREAIHAAVSMANPGDIILVAGKGHEKYQEIKGKKYPFDDKKELFERLLNEITG